MKRHLLSLSLFVVTGCSAPSSPLPAPSAPEAGMLCPEIGLELGTNTQAGSVALNDGQTVGVVLGFQGFRFLDGAAKLTGADPKEDYALFRVQVTFQNHNPTIQERMTLLTDGPDGTRVAESVQIFFNDIPMAELLDEYPPVDAEVTVGHCTGKQTLHLYLVEGGSCADMAQQGTMFPDGGGPCGDPSDGGLGDAGP